MPTCRLALHGAACGELVDDIEVRLRTFTGALLSAVRSLGEIYGEAEFKARWRNDFPALKLQELEGALAHSAR